MTWSHHLISSFLNFNCLFGPFLTKSTSKCLTIKKENKISKKHDSPTLTNTETHKHVYAHWCTSTQTHPYTERPTQSHPHTNCREGDMVWDWASRWWKGYHLGPHTPRVTVHDCKGRHQRDHPRQQTPHQGAEPSSHLEQSRPRNSTPIGRPKTKASYAPKRKYWRS